MSRGDTRSHFPNTKLLLLLIPLNPDDQCPFVGWPGELRATASRSVLQKVAFVTLGAIRLHVNQIYWLLSD